MANLDDHLKQAILTMPLKERDKLLLRLVAKDAKLIAQLQFQLVEGGSTLDSRFTDIRQQILEQLPNSETRYNTPGWLMMDLRSLNGRITEHVRVTKDKPGEVILGSLMLAEAVRRNRDLLYKMQHRVDKFAPYFVKRTTDLVKKAEKLHEDYHLEFRDNLNLVLQFIQEYPPTQKNELAKNLPTYW